MLNWKKKLGALVPGEARAHLQNALTVEWSGHKTVLVEVPQAQQSDDVEMDGFGGDRSRSGYGRLADDDDEGYGDGRAADSFVRPRLGRGRSSPTTDSYEPAAGAGRSHPHSHLRSESTPTVAGSASRARKPERNHEIDGAVRPTTPLSENPFNDPFFHDDDFSAAAAMIPDPPRKAAAGTPTRPPRPVLPLNIWETLGEARSPTSSSSSGSGSVPGSAGMPGSALVAPPQPGGDPFYSDRRW